MDRFQQLRIFVAVAEEQGFAAAARRLQLSPPAVTRAVAALEHRLRVKLLNRTTRFVRATESGSRYLEDARHILQELEAADDAAAGVHANPRGHLSITAPVMFGRMFVTPGITDYLERFPEVSVSALFLDRVVNLLEEGMDVGVRIGELPDSSMRALRVGTVRHILCAAPTYLAEYGIPQQPQDLQAHRLIASSAGSRAPGWAFVVKGKAHSIKMQSRLEVTTNDAAIQAAVEGFGITRVISYQVAPQLSRGELKTVLELFEPAPLPIHILHREGQLATSKVRGFIDLLAERLREDPALN